VLRAVSVLPQPPGLKDEKARALLVPADGGSMEERSIAEHSSAEHSRAQHSTAQHSRAEQSRA
jgi:hypothetical protein